MNDATQFFNTTASGGYQIQRSIRLNSADSAHLSRTPASAGNRKTWTWAGWVKLSKLLSGEEYLFGAYGAGNDNGYLAVYWTSGGALRISGWSQLWLETTQVFRDFSAWGHLTIVADTANATANNRFRIYWNGVEITTFSTRNNPTQNIDLPINNSVAHYIGEYPFNPGGFTDSFDGYLADCFLIDGQALDPTSFGEFDDNGIWQPKAYTGSFGTNGFHLPFSDNSTAAALGTDSAGSNDWTVNNISVASGAGNDSVVDVPTNGTASSGADPGGSTRGNYCTLNPLCFEGTPTLSNGNLDLKAPSAAYASSYSTFAIPSDKYYWEITVVTPQSSFSGQALQAGICQTPTAMTSPQSPVIVYGYNSSNLTTYSYQVPSGSQTSAGTAPTAGDILQFAVDGTTGKVWAGLNGTWFASGNPGSGTSPLYTYATTVSLSAYARIYSTTPQVAANFGQRPFAYTAPSGFKALNTANLDAPLVTKPSTVMDVVTYTGTGSARSITGLEFSPDLVWIKKRSGTSDHNLQDVIRGVTHPLYSNLTNAEGTYAQGVTAFNSDGFSVGNGNDVNGSAGTYVGWTWDAGGAPTTNNVAGAGNVPTAGSAKINGANMTTALAGSIPATRLSVNANAGFSIVSYTGNGSAGATIAHGLGIAPAFVVVKGRNHASSWHCYHASIGNTSAIFLNSTATPNATSVYWNNTSPNASTFTVGTSDGMNGSTLPYVAYCFAPVAGYSAFGSYTGTGSSPNFIHLGFRPKFWIHKRTDSAGSWMMLDGSRSPYNVVGQQLYANLSNAESTYTGGAVDFLSNGVALRTGNNDVNGSGVPYVYIAFAESPFHYSRAR